LKKILLSLARACLLLVAVAAPAAFAADVYPNKPIRLMVGFPPGGPADIAARIIAMGLQDILKQNVVVENRTGAGGNIASQLVAQAPADGYTLLAATASLTLNPLISANAGYDALKDFVPVALVATQANALAVNAGVGAKTVSELQALIKTQKMAVATSGVGTSSDLSATNLFKVLWNSDVTMVPYRGAGPAGVALASGEPQIGFMTITGVLPLHQQGKVRILAVVNDKRLPGLPAVPTMAEAGYPQLTPSWTAVFAPAGTPQAIVKRLNDATNALMATPEFKEKFAQQAMLAADSRTPAQLVDYMRSEVRTWERLVKAAGVSIK
jgi:tripartite-type tricarboxylate transporter receptor subunit TctC